MAKAYDPAERSLLHVSGASSRVFLGNMSTYHVREEDRAQQEKRTDDFRALVDSVLDYGMEVDHDVKYLEFTGSRITYQPGLVIDLDNITTRIRKKFPDLKVRNESGKITLLIPKLAKRDQSRTSVLAVLLGYLCLILFCWKLLSLAKPDRYYAPF